jgi:hypothetical protein
MDLKIINKNTGSNSHGNKILKKDLRKKTRDSLREKQILSLELLEGKHSKKVKILKQKTGSIKLVTSVKKAVTRNRDPSKDIVLMYCIKGIITRDQLHSSYKIRRAFRLITEGTQMRVTQYKDPLFKQNSSLEYDDNPHDILMQDLYADWADEMTVQKYPVGAILDILIDEMSLSSVCKKWRKRNGWAKDIFQKSLDIYREIYIRKIG